MAHFGIEVSHSADTVFWFTNINLTECFSDNEII